MSRPSRYIYNGHICYRLICNCYWQSSKHLPEICSKITIKTLLFWCIDFENISRFGFHCWLWTRKDFTENLWNLSISTKITIQKIVNYYYTNTYIRTYFLIDALWYVRQFLASESLLKWLKMLFFIFWWKAVLVLKIFKFLS